MKYYICQYKRKISQHASQHALDLAFEKSNKRDIYKILIPDFVIALKLYTSKGYYGEIIKETNCLFYIQRHEKDNLIDCMIMNKQRLEQLFINQTFIMQIEVSENEDI